MSLKSHKNLTGADLHENKPMQLAGAVTTASFSSGTVTTQFNTTALNSAINTQIAANTDLTDAVSKKHVAVTVTDSAEIDFSLTGQDITASLKAGISAEKLADGSISNAEFQSLNGVTGNIQTQIDGKAPTVHNHDDRYYTESEIDAQRSVLETSISGKAPTSHNHTIADTTGLQAALDGKAASVHNHNTIYYTKAEVDALVAAASPIVGVYASDPSGTFANGQEYINIASTPKKKFYYNGTWYDMGSGGGSTPPPTSYSIGTMTIGSTFVIA